MNIEQKVLEYCKLNNLMQKNVGVGVSGGADSIFLLYFLNKYKRELGIENLKVVHINHCLREKESDGDESFVKSICENWGIYCQTISIDVNIYAQKHKCGIEESARILRYQCFAKFAKENDIDVFALAHHKNDQAETVLMHILRGSGLTGACGMSACSGLYVRPLLCVSKEEIVSELHKKQIEFRTDSTNADNSYSRNFIRNEILTALEKVYPASVNAICAFAENCKKDEQFIRDNLATGYIKERKEHIEIKLSAFELCDSLKYRILKDAFYLAGAKKDIEQKHLEMLNELSKLKSGSMQNFPMNVVGYKDYDCVSLKRSIKKNKEIEVDFTVPQKFECCGGNISVSYAKSVKFEEGVQFVDYMKIPQESIWRTRQNGDVFMKLGSGTKKLNDYFTDKKIVQRKRDEILLLCYKNEVLVVANADISEKVKIDSTTDKVIEIKYRGK